LNESGRLEYAYVTRDACEGHRQRRGEVGDACVAVAQRLQEPTARGIGERGIRPIQELIFNHIVDYSW
jgi:hypothetical protein